MLDAGSAHPSSICIDLGCSESREMYFMDSFGSLHMSYRNLDVWQLAKEMTTEIHRMTMQSLPKHEMYEVGSQIRRSAKSVRSNIVEGYGRRRYKQDFIRFLTYALSSCDETRDHLEVLLETGSLTDENAYTKLAKSLDELGKKLNNFIASVERDHRSVRDSVQPYADFHEEDSIQSDDHPASSIQHLASDDEKPH